MSIEAHEKMASIEEKGDIHTITQNHRSTEMAESTETSKNNHYYGMLFSFCTGICFFTSTVCIKRLNSISSPQLTTHACMGMVFFTLPTVLYKRVSFLYPLKINVYLLGRAIFASMAFNFVYLSIMYIPLTDSSVIGSCSPILTTLFARIFLKEPCGILHCVCLILTVLGMLFVSKVPLVIATRTIEYGLSYFMGITFAISGSLSFAMSNIVVRCPSLILVHYSISVLYIGTVASVISAIVTNFTFGFTLPNCGTDRFYLVLQGVIGGSVEMLATLALQYEEASIAIMVMCITNIVATFLWQTLVDGISPDLYTTIGAVIVMICILMIALRQRFPIFIKKIRRKPSEGS